MCDLISRQATIDAVNQYNFDFPQYMERFVTELRDAMKADLKHDIEALPSAQPEIIRCKDCKYCDRGIDEDGNPFLKCLGWVYGGTQEEDFCSHAERRTDE